ncbi:phage holin [Anaerotignum sp. MB30-C6]|uniref:phage holin n=1 Tax=Anaerotignum sp. MB30-C6 TaxID=3070814 RepID=UPI0027DB0058|nr:phage holin [Anaerotignum sp. MB30-C6]WMI80483.1 phage holin [Anaerotignum sp. MB30-C6]
MKINWRVRFKNPMFWIGLFGVISSTLGVRPEDFNTWSMVLEEIKYVASNPFLLVSIILAIVGVVNDPTTKGICDSKRALSYTSPKHDNIKPDDSDFGQ